MEYKEFIEHPFLKKFTKFTKIPVSGKEYKDILDELETKIKKINIKLIEKNDLDVINNNILSAIDDNIILSAIDYESINSNLITFQFAIDMILKNIKQKEQERKEELESKGELESKKEQNREKELEMRNSLFENSKDELIKNINQEKQDVFYYHVIVIILTIFISGAFYINIKNKLEWPNIIILISLGFIFIILISLFVYNFLKLEKLKKQIKEINLISTFTLKLSEEKERNYIEKYLNKIIEKAAED